jgi:hypothetical protein
VNTRLSVKTHSGRAQRNEVEPYLDYTIAITRQFFIDAYAELSLREYEARDRRDGEGMVALSANLSSDQLAHGQCYRIACRQSL